MAASLSLRVYTGTDAATESSPVSGIDMISADNAVNSPSNRATYSVGVGTNSMEKFLALKVDVAPATSVSNFEVWGDGGTPPANTALKVAGEVATGSTPVATASVIATDDFSDYDASNRLQWDDGTYTEVDDVTEFLVFQLQVAAGAALGAWEREVANYSYDES
jgi:hypothetical protein